MEINKFKGRTIMAKEMIAMILAGGQGSRLYALTQKLAKPAVPFGGKYRIIDFPLSNCVNSGIDTVGVLTQYEPHVLNAYIGSGQTWDLDRLRGGVYVLPPYESKKTEWYKGTANAIYQNIQFLEDYDPEYVLILSGDHIYKMDYNKMLQQHKETGADATIAVLDVPLSEASRFGIMNCKPDGTIYEFEEKPKEPKSTLASMGIYIFTWKKLKEYLINDEANEQSSNDFGKDIIPAMLNNGEKLVSYRFKGYWKDVGTIESLWEANMDLLNPNIPIDLYDPDWKMYSRNPVLPPQYIGENANVENSMIAEGCIIDGNIDFSVIYEGVTIENGATVTDSIIMPGSVIKEGATVEYAIVGENSIIEKGAHIGARPETVENRDDWGIAVIGNKITIAENQVVGPKQMVPDIKKK